jgi:hypothetical protein
MRLQIAFLFPKLTRGTEKDDAGEKAETDGRAAAAEEVVVCRWRRGGLTFP